MGEQGDKVLTAESKILIVDDYEMVRIMLRSSLNQIGYHHIEEAIDGQDAFNKLQAAAAFAPYKLVFSDWNMPQMSGMELLQKCRQDHRFKNLPFIMVTAESEKDEVIRALRSGVNQYIIKPFSPEVLDKKIKSVFAKLKVEAA